MKQKVFILFVIVIFTFNIVSCTLFKKTIDSKTGLINLLQQTEASILNDAWHDAKIHLHDSEKIWKKVKPWLQLDMDHDYVKDIEDNFTRLKAYIDTEEKPDSLATILLIMDTWENISIY